MIIRVWCMRLGCIWSVCHLRVGVGIFDLHFAEDSRRKARNPTCDAAEDTQEVVHKQFCEQLHEPYRRLEPQVAKR